MAHINITLVWSAQPSLQCFLMIQFYSSIIFPSVILRLVLLGGGGGSETWSIREALNMSVPRIFGPLREHVNVIGENSRNWLHHNS